MDPTSRCSNKDALIAYLYDECDARARSEMESHLLGCDACAQEVRAFRSVRENMAAWTPPERPLGLRVVTPDRMSRGFWRRFARRPAWALAAAALLIVALAGALTTVEVRYGRDGFMFRIGSAAAVSSQPPPATVWRADLERLEQQLRQEIGAGRQSWPGEAQNVVTVADAGAAEPDRDALLGRVQRLIEESERRQQRELALRMMQMAQEFQEQRRIDLRAIDQTLDQNFGELDYLLRVSGR